MFNRKDKKLKESFEHLERLVQWNDNLNDQVKQAKYHIKKHVRDFPPKELECLCMDDLIKYKDVPEDLATDFIKNNVECD